MNLNNLGDDLYHVCCALSKMVMAAPLFMAPLFMAPLFMTPVPAVMIGQLQPPPVPEGAAASGVVHNERPNDITGGQSHGPPTPPPRPPHGRSMSVDVKSSK